MRWNIDKTLKKRRDDNLQEAYVLTLMSLGCPEDQVEPHYVTITKRPDSESNVDQGLYKRISDNRKIGVETFCLVAQAKKYGDKITDQVRRCQPREYKAKIMSGYISVDASEKGLIDEESVFEAISDYFAARLIGLAVENPRGVSWAWINDLERAFVMFATGLGHDTYQPGGVRRSNWKTGFNEGIGHASLIEGLEEDASRFAELGIERGVTTSVYGDVEDDDELEDDELDDQAYDDDHAEDDQPDDDHAEEDEADEDQTENLNPFVAKARRSRRNRFWANTAKAGSDQAKTDKGSEGKEALS